MKLWRRRPLSEDFSRKDVNIPDEMPPTLVYISPGNQRISKRLSLTNHDNLAKFQCSPDFNSFHVNESDNRIENKSSSKSYHFQSFRNYESKPSIKFDEGTLKSNRDCKSYLSPVSVEWSPVKDVMKICRSASVPFHSRNVSKTEVQETKVQENNISKSPHLSISEKIKIFFRNRSTSRPAKPALTSITENKSIKSSANNEKRLNRTSRPRKKDVDRCKSLYEPSNNFDTDYLQRFEHVLKNKTSLTDTNISPTIKKSTHKEKKNEEKNTQSVKKLKVDRKTNVVNETQKRLKAQSFNPDSSQRNVVRGFSSSVISHTTSSAAKCKSNSPKSSESNHCTNSNLNYQKSNRNSEKYYICKTSEISATNYNRKTSAIFDSSDFGKSESPVSHKPPQAVIAPKSDKKIVNLGKTDVLAIRSARFDSKGCTQNSEYLLPSKVTPPVLTISETQKAVIDQRHCRNSADYDDYVTLTEVNMSLPINSSIMTKSLYVSVLPDISNANHAYANIEMNAQTPIRKNNYQKDDIFQKIQHRMTHTGGEIRKRPISCMAVVNADCQKPTSELDNTRTDKQTIFYPKSPYLSQYSKLYSLRTNDMDLISKYGYEMVENDLMTRSQHSGHYRVSNSICKDQTGKLSIDSGLVDDINAFHSDCVQSAHN